MRFFQSNDGQAVIGFPKGEQAAIDVALVDGMIEVASMHPGAQEIVWQRTDGTISVTTVMPEMLAAMERTRGLLALDRLVVADAATAAETALADVLVALDAAERAVSGGAQASKLRLAVRDHIAGIRQQMDTALAEANREAMAAIGQIEARDAELIATEQAGAQAQAELNRLQGLLKEAEAAQLVALREGEQASALAASMDITPEERQQHIAALNSAHYDESLAARTVAEITTSIGGMAQFVNQAKAATTERQQLQTARRERNTQDEAAAAAIRANAARAIAELDAKDKELAALEFAAARAGQQMDVLTAAHMQKQTALAAARKLVEDIASAEQTATTIGATLEEHMQILKASGAVPADWTLAAIYPAEAAWRPDWPVQDDLVWDAAAGAVVVDLARARETTCQRLRIERAPLLESLDIRSMRNLEAGADNSAVVAEKNRLRDVTALPEACGTIEELRGLKC